MDVLTDFRTEILAFLAYITRAGVVTAVSLAVVYLLGRMLSLVRCPSTKNFIAFMAMLSMHTFHDVYLVPAGPLPDLIWSIAVNTGISVLIYVLFGFKLYDRCDDFLDKRLGKARPLPRTRKK